MIRDKRQAEKARAECAACQHCNGIDLEDVIYVLASGKTLGGISANSVDLKHVGGETYSAKVTDKAVLLFIWREPNANILQLKCDGVKSS